MHQFSRNCCKPDLFFWLIGGKSCSQWPWEMTAVIENEMKFFIWVARSAARRNKLRGWLACHKSETTIARSFKSNNGEGEITLAVRCTRERRAARKRTRKQESPPPRAVARMCGWKRARKSRKPGRLPATQTSHFCFIIRARGFVSQNAAREREVSPTGSASEISNQTGFLNAFNFNKLQRYSSY